MHNTVMMMSVMYHLLLSLHTISLSLYVKPMNYVLSVFYSLVKTEC